MRLGEIELALNEYFPTHSFKIEREYNYDRYIVTIENTQGYKATTTINAYDAESDAISHPNNPMRYWIRECAQGIEQLNARLRHDS